MPSREFRVPSELRDGFRLNTYPPPDAPPVGPEAIRGADLKALAKIRLFAIVLLLGAAASLVIGFLYSLSFFASFSGRIGPGNTLAQSFGSFTNSLYVTLAISAAISMFGLYQLRVAFKTLAGMEKEHFGISSTLTLLLLIVQPIVLAGVAISFTGLFSVMSSIPLTSPANSTALASNFFNSGSFGLFLIGSGISGIGGILGLVGAIGGPMLGLWRAGTRYGEGVLKAGGILYFIPIVESILILVGMSSAKTRVNSANPQT